MTKHRILSPEELEQANDLLATIRKSLDELSNGDADLRFAFNRKLSKELTYDERAKPMVRKQLKVKKRIAQGGLCATCHTMLPEAYNVLDRFHAPDGYTEENSRLICQACDKRIQAERRYA